MSFSFSDFTGLLIAQLGEDERRGCVAYAAEAPLLAGTRVQLPGTLVEVDTDSYLGFIDREPTANWGHDARYVTVDVENGGVHSQDARLPPFRSGAGLVWRVVYKAPSVPDAAVQRSL